MSKKHKYGNIDHDDLLRYVQGEMSDEDRHALEREIQKDLFTSEALEGLSSIRIEEARADLDKLESQLNKRSSGRKSAVWIRIAASVVILLTIGTLYFTLFTDMINQTDRMAVETESKEESRDQNATGRVQPSIDSETSALTGGQDQSEILQEEALEMEAEEPRTSEILVKSQPRSMAEITDQDDEIKSEIHGREEDALAENVLLDGAAEGEDSAVFMDSEVMADQVEIVVEPEEEQEILSEEYAMEGPADRSRVSSSRMVAPSSAAGAPVSEHSGANAAATSAKKLIGSGQSPATISAQILSDSISTNPVGGLDSFRQYIKENMVFPVEESPNTPAKVILSFTVDTSGRPGDIEVIESAGDPFSQEAARLLQEGPDWTPSQAKTRLQIKFNQ